MHAMVLPSKGEMFAALVDRDPAYEGVFVVAVKSTGIFCRPTCPAKKPKRANVEFYSGAREALALGYRPCLRCRPLEPAGAAPAWLGTLLLRVQAEPERRFGDQALRDLGVDPARVRRWFLRHHGMTFQSYQRSRRLGAAMGRLKSGSNVTTAAFDSGYESLSAFGESFRKLFGAAPKDSKDQRVVTIARVLTPLGTMLAGATSDDELCLLEFGDRRSLEAQLRKLSALHDAVLVVGSTPALARAETQVGEYFAGARTRFELPLSMPGTPFQQRAWRELLGIPYGHTRTYGEQAKAMGSASAVRAVGRANGMNRIGIVVPCHRVVGDGGKLTGYGGGLWRKRALLELERRVLAGQRFDQNVTPRPTEPSSLRRPVKPSLNT